MQKYKENCRDYGRDYAASGATPEVPVPPPCF